MSAMGKPSTYCGRLLWTATYSKKSLICRKHSLRKQIVTRGQPLVQY